MFNIVLYQPEIPPNTGNIIRLCANTGCTLQLVEPLGFDMNDKLLRRAGLDYHEWARVELLPDLSALPARARTFAIETTGERGYHKAGFMPGDNLVFGPETRGLPTDYLDTLGKENVLRLPMLATSRSLNLSNSVAVVVYEALRQNGFDGLE